MKKSTNTCTELTTQELAKIDGGFLFLIGLAGLAVNSVNAAILASPAVGSIVKGWKSIE